MPPWRNWLARSAVNRKVGGSSPPGGEIFIVKIRSLIGRPLCRYYEKKLLFCIRYNIFSWEWQTLLKQTWIEKPFQEIRMTQRKNIARNQNFLKRAKRSKIGKTVQFPVRFCCRNLWFGLVYIKTCYLSVNNNFCVGVHGNEIFTGSFWHFLEEDKRFLKTRNNVWFSGAKVWWRANTRPHETSVILDYLLWQRTLGNLLVHTSLG